MSAILLKDELAKYNFYHAIEVEPGIFTDGILAFKRSQDAAMAGLQSLEISGKKVLDIGCRDGLFSFAAEKAGAREIIGIDNDLSRGAVDVLIPHFKSRVQMHQLNVMDLLPDSFGHFDVVICAGLLYHLRYPVYALKRIRDVMKNDSVLFIETAVFTLYPNIPLIYCPVGDESPYEPTSVTFFNIRGLTSTLRSLGMRVISHKLLDGGRRTVDRAILTCTADSSLTEPSVDRYWEKTHENHSSGNPEHRVSGRATKT